MWNSDRRQPSGDASRAVLNALAILESFEDRRATQSLSELSRRLGLPKATVFRNLAALELKGYVCRDPESGQYSLGPQVLQLSRRFSNQNSLLKVGVRHIAELAEITGETTHLSILNGREVVYVDVSPGRQAIRAVVERGDRLPAHCVASGKAILAHVRSDSLAEFLAGELELFTPRTLATPAEFVAEMEKVHRSGYATCVGEWLEEVSAVAAPVFGENDKVVGAIGLAGPRVRLTQDLLENISFAVINQAGRLSSDLGASKAGVPSTRRQGGTGPFT